MIFQKRDGGAGGIAKTGFGLFSSSLRSDHSAAAGSHAEAQKSGQHLDWECASPPAAGRHRATDFRAFRP